MSELVTINIDIGGVMQAYTSSRPAVMLYKPMQKRAFVTDVNTTK